MSNQNNVYDSIDDSEFNTSVPGFERVRRGDEGEEDKVCRICLEEDSPETMIAPCLCKGGSKWVHRECLDEWRTNERDRAFSKCTECLFEYHLQPVYKDEESDSNCCIPCKPQSRRQALFYWMVSRDACLGLVLQQIIVIFLATVVLACDSDHQLPNLLLGMESLSESKLIWVYYGFGWFVFFIALGLYGSVVMCTNGCDVNRAIPNLGPPSEADEEEGPAPATPVRRNSTASIPNQQYSYTSYQRRSNRNDGYYDAPSSSCSSSTMFYRRARRRHYHRRHSYWYNDHYYYYPSYYYYPIYVGNDDSCCCCCCCNTVGHHHGHCCGGSSSGCFGTDCCPGSIHSAIGASRGGSFSGSRSSSSSSNGGSNDAQHILLMILLVVTIVLAIIGFFVGVVIVVVAAQRIVGRHIYLLQKRQLVHEFKVMDLQDYDLDQPLQAAQTEETVGSGFEMREGVARHPPPSAPAMPMEDVQYLKKLGLMDR